MGDDHDDVRLDNTHDLLKGMMFDLKALGTINVPQTDTRRLWKTNLTTVVQEGLKVQRTRAIRSILGGTPEELSQV